MERKEYYKRLGWQKSPFIKSTSIDIPIIERVQECEEVSESIGGWDRIMVITAPIGYGKTTFMNQLMLKKPKDVKYVVGFNAYEPVREVMEKIKGNLPFTKRLFMKAERTSFGEELQKALGRNKMLLIFDESQDYQEDIFKWLRILNDRTDNLFMIFLGLRGLEDKISGEASFRDRKSRSIRLQAFEVEDLEEMVRQRIEWAGGLGIRPFTEDGLRRLCESCHQVPRQLLENGQRVIEEASKKGVKSLDSDFVEEVLGYQAPSLEETCEEPVQETDDEQVAEEVSEPEASNNPIGSYDFMADLSPTQKEIVNLMLKHDSLSVSELSEVLDKDIRSIGSLIRKLRGLNKKEVQRKPNVPYPVIIRKGKEVRLGRLQYVYSLSDNSRRLLARA